MDRGIKAKTSAQQLVDIELETLQHRVATSWKGREKEAVIGTVRALDSIAVSRLLDNLRGEKADIERVEHRELRSMGAAAALRPFLSAMKVQAGGVPWGRTTQEGMGYFHSYLKACGELTFLRRMTKLEQYGLARTSIPTPGRLIIEVPHSGPEYASLAAVKSWRSRLQKISHSTEPSSAEWERLTLRMKSYVETDSRYFIRYDNDEEIVSAFRRRAAHYGSGFLEAEAFPDGTPIGDRTFGNWKQACEQALGRIFCHIEFALILAQKYSSTVLTDVLTIFVKRDDIRNVWLEAGLHPSLVGPTMDALTLDFESLDDWEGAFETPCSFYIDLEKDFLLLPCFGGLTNPYFSLFRHLRRIYASDWDRGVDQRELVFRADLSNALSEPDFLIPQHGFTLRRDDGSKLTDLDAVALDRRFGTLALIQLKWHDVFGRSLAERDSRRRNIAKANEWIARVHKWVDGRSSAAIARALGLRAVASEKPPILFVIARYNARFSGDGFQDSRAHWLGWPEFLNAAYELHNQDLLAIVSQWVADSQAALLPFEDRLFRFRSRNFEAEVKVSANF